MNKLISVIIPTHNRKDLTDRAVSSIITSSPSLIEIIVVDDFGSSEYSFVGLNDSGVSVTVIRLDKNVGAGMARKAGVAFSTGKFIAFLDSDDCYDSMWINYLQDYLQTEVRVTESNVVISGITVGGKIFGRKIREVLTWIPQPLQLFTTRVLVLFFNPFYTPSIVMSRELCSFMNGLRYCEDYYSNSFALFKSKNIYFPKVIACNLGRLPNTFGGESNHKRRMFKGEMTVRVALLRASWVPCFYKLLIPVGMAYQWLRHAIKIFIDCVLHKLTNN